MKPALRLDLGQVGVDQASELLAEGDEGVNKRVARVRLHLSGGRVYRRASGRSAGWPDPAANGRAVVARLQVV